MSEEKKTNPLAALIGLAVVGCVLWYYLGGGLEQSAQKQMGRIEQQVATDSEKQYDIAKRSGSAMDAYVQSSLVAAAYLQAKDEANYKKWKQIEKQEATLAGVPQ